MWSRLRQSPSTRSIYGRQVKSEYRGDKNTPQYLMRANVIVDDKGKYFDPNLLNLNLEWEHVVLINAKHNESATIKGITRYNSLKV